MPGIFVDVKNWYCKHLQEGWKDAESCHSWLNLSFGINRSHQKYIYKVILNVFASEQLLQRQPKNRGLSSNFKPHLFVLHLTRLITWDCRRAACCDACKTSGNGVTFPHPDPHKLLQYPSDIVNQASSGRPAASWAPLCPIRPFLSPSRWKWAKHNKQPTVELVAT